MKVLDTTDVFAAIQEARDADRDLIRRLREALDQSIALHVRDNPFMKPDDQHAIGWWRLLVEEAK